MALSEGCRLVSIATLGDHVIGGRGGVGEDHRNLALGEQAIGLRPARSYGQDATAKLGPCLFGVVAVDGLHPQEQSEPRGGGAWILDHDLLRPVSLHQILQARRRGVDGLGVVDDCKMSVVIGDEDVVPVAARHRDCAGIETMRLEQARRLGFCGKIGVETQDDVGLGIFAFELQPGEKRDAVGHSHEVHPAPTGLLELRLYPRARAPFGREAFVGIDGKAGLLGKSRRQSGQSRDESQKSREPHPCLLADREEIEADGRRLIPPPVLTGSGSAGWWIPLSRVRHPVRSARDLARDTALCKRRPGAVSERAGRREARAAVPRSRPCGPQAHSRWTAR